jgi:2-polyprenyl-3-methyl-5-hydroxy-6-metoxy-1,4-benzoquinol methylase
MTVRGLERYVSRLGSQPNHPAQPEIESPLLALTTAGAIRSGNWDANAQWVAAAFVHDFSGYHQSEREDVVPIIPGAVRRVLDVGGGEGGFLTALKSSLKCETHLSEISSAACAIATQRVDQVWQGDFLRAPIDVKFDCITFLDVLEHTEWPVQWLSRAVGMLEPQGCVVASIPNVGHWSVVLDLLEGRWDYAPAGIHCITHLRFFTRYGTEQLMSEAGLKIERIESVQVAAPPWFDVSAMQKNLTIDLESLSSVAYLVRAKPIA